jgi:hypothetical protein
MLFLTRGRPLLRAALGVVVVVAGLFILTRILLTVGGVLILWGIAGEIGRRRARGRGRSPDESSER